MIELHICAQQLAGGRQVARVIGLPESGIGGAYGRFFILAAVATGARATSTKAASVVRTDLSGMRHS
ncbi:hypothetical protein Xcc1_21300 [Xanthomonas campestris pv. campestris]|nr:hypothetical protein Xcc1_21300 [Xanthomonas campestris pv. campestris]